MSIRRWMGTYTRLWCGGGMWLKDYFDIQKPSVMEPNESRLQDLPYPYAISFRAVYNEV